MRVKTRICKSSAEPAGFRYGSFSQSQALAGDFIQLGNHHPPKSELSHCQVKRNVKCYIFALFRSAWRTAWGSFPASWRTTTLLSLYTSKCSVGICKNSPRAWHKCLRGEREIPKPVLAGVSAAAAPVQPLSLCTGGFCSAKPWNCPRLFLTPQRSGERGKASQGEMRDLCRLQ